MWTDDDQYEDSDGDADIECEDVENADEDAQAIGWERTVEATRPREQTIM